MPAVLARHEVLLRQAIEAHGGHVFKMVGDQCCAAFPTAPAALRAALAVSGVQAGCPLGERSGVQEEPISGPERLNPRTPERLNPRTPERLDLRLRIALHTGTALERDGDYLGPALNRVARLLAAAHGGQILLSRATHELVREHLPEDASLRDLGTHRLKDLQQPEHVFQLQHSCLPTELAPVRSLEAFAHNLPIQVTSFVGREAEIAEVKRLLTATRLLTLTGAGGCGKTRLALQVAADLLEGEDDGAWFVDLAPLTDPALLAQTVASVLGIREEPGRPLAQTVVDALLPRKLLLILDNCEHVLEASAALAGTIMRRCPGVQILATSRERLNLPGETAYRIPSLSAPDPSTLNTELFTLTQYEAVRLFIDRAIAVVPAFVVTNENAPAVAEVCHRLDGIPLAIELAAARVRVLPAEQIAARLDDRFRLLTGGSRASLPRQQTLRALIDWSYDLLSEPEQALLRLLSVFAGGWTLEAVEAVCSGVQEGAMRGAEDLNARTPERLNADEVLDLLTSLVDKSLAQYEERAGGGRYRLLETIRQYARERLEAEGEAAAAQARHGDWFLSLAERAEPELWGPRQVEWLDRLEQEHDNLRAALSWCGKTLDSSQWLVDGPATAGSKLDRHSSEPTTNHQPQTTAVEKGLRLGGALWRLWELRGYLGEGREHLTAMLALPGAETRTAVRARALRSAGAMAYCQGDCGAVRSYCEEALAIFREIGDRSGIGWSLNYLRWTATFQGDDETARTLAEESLAAFREAGDQPGITWGLCSLAWGGLAVGGDRETARALAEESLRISRAIGYKEAMAWSIGLLGDLGYYAGDYGTARALWEESLTMLRELGHSRAISLWLFDIAELTRAQKDYGEARALYRESLEMSRQQGNRRLIARNLEGMAAAAIEQAQYERAARLHGAAEALRAANGDAPFSLSPAGYERSITTLREALGEGAFIATCAEWRAMPLPEVLALAMEE
jgi:predicted ATPase/class 3 adenylate cyclase